MDTPEVSALKNNRKVPRIVNQAHLNAPKPIEVKVKLEYQPFNY